MQLEVVTPSGVAAAAEADEITAPGVRGEFGVLPGHTAFLSALKPGVLSWKSKGKKGTLAVGPGYAEVNGKDKVVVLTQLAATVEQIDPAQAQKDLDEADKLLKDWKPTEGGPSRESLEGKRAWAQARLDTRKQ
jgi:F-type H+-transporting ATPase subunit epsilon